ncbi:hypothetical protein [Streptomyces longispororuber]|uniref:hypothetical protein n=1 Tax=Streptomyces longispororuber TaxID=68230 RepID=UPI0036FA1D35
MRGQRPLAAALGLADGGLGHLLVDVVQPGLGELGLIDPDQLAEQCANVAATGEGASELYRPLALEASLRSLAAACT